MHPESGDGNGRHDHRSEKSRSEKGSPDGLVAEKDRQSRRRWQLYDKRTAEQGDVVQNRSPEDGVRQNRGKVVQRTEMRSGTAGPVKETHDRGTDERDDDKAGIDGESRCQKNEWRAVSCLHGTGTASSQALLAKRIGLTCKLS